MEFKNFKLEVQKKFQVLVDNNQVLYLTNIDKDLIWDTYLESYPKGTNNIYIERGEYECNTCKQFLRPYANVVAIDANNNLVSIWDVTVEGYYQDVADKLSALVKSMPIRDKFVNDFAQLGSDHNIQLLADGTTKKWHHLSFKLPKSFVNNTTKSSADIMGTFRDHRNVFKRSLDEITLDSVKTVLELIEQGSLYRGDEYKNMVVKFLENKNIYKNIPEVEKNNYCWKEVSETGSVSKIRTTTIGTLLIDISKGEKTLDKAVFSFENKMDPTKFKRPRSVVTQRQIEEGEKTIIELGLENSLVRRYAKLDDITINNVIFANRDAKKSMKKSVFDEMKEEVNSVPKKFDKVEEMMIEDFISNVVPKSTSIELMMENSHINNLVSLISPLDKESPSMFKWSNNFTWAYNGDIADSMKDRVKAAGGNVEGVLRFSIQWNDGDNNKNDFDAHCIEPGGNQIFYSSLVNYTTGGNLDVDIQNPGNKIAVENITWPNKNKMEEGKYKFFVKNFSHNGGTTGFTAEIEFEGQIYSYSYNKELRNKEDVLVAEIEFSKKNGIKFITSLESSVSYKEVWKVNTNKFQKVSTLMFSPNYWDDQKGIGNKHYFFMLANCINDGKPRGFFNEFLNQDLMEHKRVFEVLGSKMRVEESEDQLSGLGFSSTQRNSIVVKVKGTFERVLKINF